MRLTRFIDLQGELHYGMERGDGRADVLEGSPLLRPPKTTGSVVSIGRRLSPVDPVNLFCIGANYRDHCEELGMDPPQRPVVFMKPTTALQNPGEPIRLPRCQLDGPEVDFEGELAVVIGQECRDLSEDEALNCVIGFTIANDVSARHWQKHGSGGQYTRGKGFDTFCPLGPVLVTPGDIPDPQALEIVTRVNGTVMQESSTANMIFSVAQLVSFLSQDTTLRPGSVILTGTPAGVGMGRDPQVFLQPGDTVEITIDPIGTLSNTVESA